MMRTTGMKKYLLTGGLSAILTASLVLPASAAPDYKDTSNRSNENHSAACYSITWSKNANPSIVWGSNGEKQSIPYDSLKLQSDLEGFSKWWNWNLGDSGNTGNTDNSGNTGNTNNSSNSGNTGNTGNLGNSDNSGTTNQDNSGLTATDKSQFASEVIKLVNQERAKQGLQPLTGDSALNNMALVKAKDMNDNNYFSHTSPTYGSPFEMMKSFGISYRYAGENIAMGQKTPAEVVNAWMNSEGHRANILSANFTLIGVGYYNGYWAQEFVGR
ncbi:CAP domain-containing protein [Paenibacillus antibioticophila]